jgi:hypothetical protein
MWTAAPNAGRGRLSVSASESSADAPVERRDQSPAGVADGVNPVGGPRRMLSLPGAPSKATYRFPLGLREQLKAVAKVEGVPVDDLARLALECFLADYQAGRVELRKHAIPARFTLYPREPGPGASS